MSEKITIDVWGHIRGESDDFRVKPVDVYQVDAPEDDDADGDTFERYANECPCAMQRTKKVTAGGRVTIQRDVTYGDWTLRATELDWKPISVGTLEVYRQEIIASNQEFNATAGSEITGATVAASLLYGEVGEDTKFAFQQGSGITGVELSSAGVLSGTVSTAGTYQAKVEIIAPLAKHKVITITLTVSE
jgi:hypothetical protein